jgi:hypothetical protein
MWRFSGFFQLREVGGMRDVLRRSGVNLAERQRD